MRRSCATLLLTCLCLGSTAPARAQGHSDAEHKLEAALICYGKLQLECFGARLQEALALAREQRSTPKLVGRIYLHLGVHHAVLNQRSKATRAFREALRRDPLLDLDPQQFKPELVALFGKARAGLKGTLAVSADARGAVVYLDGGQIGVTPLQVNLTIGRHTVRVTGPGSKHEEQVLIRVDKTTRVQATLGVPAAVRQTKSSAPVAPPPPPTTTTTTTTQPGRVWTWVAAGGAAVTLAVAIGLGASASADHSAWEEELGRGQAGGGDRQTWEALGQDVEAKATAANVFFATSGVLAVTAAVLFFVEGRPTERPTTTRTSMGPGPGGVYGLSLTRSF